MTSRAVLIKFPEKTLESIDSLVEDGFFDNRSAAIRESVRQTLRDFAGCAGRAETPSVDAAREAREKLWREAFEKAGGDEKLAFKLLAERANKTGVEFFSNIPKARQR